MISNLLRNISKDLSFPCKNKLLNINKFTSQTPSFLKFVNISKQATFNRASKLFFPIVLSGMTVAGSIFLDKFSKSTPSDWIDDYHLRSIIHKMIKNPLRVKEIISDLKIYPYSFKKKVVSALLKLDPEMLGSAIKYFEFTNLEEFCIADDIRQKNPETLALHIKNFQNLKKSDLSYLANSYIVNDQDEYFPSFIDLAPMGEKERISVASVTSEHSPELLNSYMEKFRIQDEEIRYQLALHLTDRCPSALASSIDKYKLPKDHLRKIAFLLLDNSPEALALHISSYHLDEPDLKKIALTILDITPEILITFIDTFGIKDLNFIDQIKKDSRLKIVKAQEERGSTALKIDSILKQRIQNSNTEEYKRLLLDNRISDSLKEIDKHIPDLTIEEKIGIGQSIELRQKLQDKYYVINHGQNNRTIIINIVAKIAKKIFNQKEDAHLETLRDTVFLQNSNKEILDISSLKYKLTYDFYLNKPNLTDHNFRSELIAGDLVFENTETRESAISFYSGEVNIAFKKGVFESNVFNSTHKSLLLKKILEVYFSNAKIIEETLEKLEKISPSDLEGGTLYSICVPKNKIFSVGYVSGSGGRPWYEPLTLKDLDSYQNGKFSKEDGSFYFLREPYSKSKYSYELKSTYPTYYSGGRTPTIPQFRLLTKKLTKEEGIFIIPHSTLSAEKISQLERTVEECLLQAKTQDSKIS